MAEGAHSFCEAHPSDDAGYASVMAKFEERLGRADVLAKQERAGRTAWRASTREKKALRRELQSQLLNHLVRVSEVAAKERPELAERFRLASRNAANKVFLTTARAILADAQEFTELLVKNGMSESMFAELTTTLARLDEVTETARKGRREQVGARADLAAVIGELMELVALLDGLNRFRFRNDPELKAAWESARNVVGPFKAKAETTESGGTETRPADGQPNAA